MYKFTAALLLFLASLSCSAQNVGFGIKAGANYSVLNNMINSSTSFRAGPHAGIYGYFRPSNSFAIQPEVIYSVQGCKNEGRYNSKTTTNLSYINIPLTFKLYMGNRFYWQLGPQLGLLAAAREKGTVGENFGGGVQMREIDMPTDRFYHDKEFSVVGGLGFNITPEFTLSGRFCYGITNLDKNPNTSRIRPAANPLTNRVFQLTIGYNFGGDHEVDSPEEEE